LLQSVWLVLYRGYSYRCVCAWNSCFFYGRYEMLANS